MIQITDKAYCCGCNACVQICPRHCIRREVDIEGFGYPVVEESVCIKCELCNKVCPFENSGIEKPRHEKPQAYAAYHKDDAIRVASTSGGLFAALADKLFVDGAYIAGAIFDDDFTLSHTATNDKATLEKIKDSKYLQSDINDVFTTIQKLLDNGEKVFICSTPCQIAGLYRYLQKDYERLYTCDFICKGVPSPKFFKAYIRSLEQKYRSKTASIKFKYKDKKYPWGRLATKIDFQNGKTYMRIGRYNSFMRAYLRTGFTVRPSCFSCRFTRYPRPADISLGDFWGIERVMPDISDRGKGYSAVLINSEKGGILLDSIKEKLFLQQVSLSEVEKGNSGLTAPYKPAGGYVPAAREKLYRDLDAHGYDYINKKYIKTPANIFDRVYRKMERMLKIW
jgi:coenzyme F420-reducing hydrogenase beta subunit